MVCGTAAGAAGSAVIVLKMSAIEVVGVVTCPLVRYSATLSTFLLISKLDAGRRVRTSPLVSRERSAEFVTPAVARMSLSTFVIPVRVMINGSILLVGIHLMFI
jgi:hypothetical protein